MKKKIMNKKLILLGLILIICSLNFVSAEVPIIKLGVPNVSKINSNSSGFWDNLDSPADFKNITLDDSINVVDSDVGMSFWSGNNKLLQLRRYSAGIPELARYDTGADGGYSYFIDGVNYFQMYANAISLYKQTIFYKYGYFATDYSDPDGAMFFGAGADSAVAYNGSDMLIDPDRVGSGSLWVGLTGDDDIYANKISNNQSYISQSDVSDYALFITKSTRFNPNYIKLENTHGTDGSTRFKVIKDASGLSISNNIAIAHSNIIRTTGILDYSVRQGIELLFKSSTVASDKTGFYFRMTPTASSGSIPIQTYMEVRDTKVNISGVPLRVEDNLNVTGNVTIGENLNYPTIYCEASDLRDQTFSVAENPYPINITTTDEGNGITMNTINGTNITIDTAGVYHMVLQPQVKAGAGDAGDFHMWLEKSTGGDFSDVPNSNIELKLSSLEEDVIVLATTMSLNQGDVVKAFVSVSDNGILLHTQTPSGEPVIPSIIFTMYRLGS